MATFTAQFTESNSLNVTFEQPDNMSAGFGEVTRVTTSDYERLINKPKINTVEVIGEKTGADYNLLDGEYATYAEIISYLNT